MNETWLPVVYIVLFWLGKWMIYLGGLLIEECNCFTINYFDEAKLKAEKVKVETGSYDNSVLLRLTLRDYCMRYLLIN